MWFRWNNLWFSGGEEGEVVWWHVLSSLWGLNTCRRRVDLFDIDFGLVGLAHLVYLVRFFGWTLKSLSVRPLSWLCVIGLYPYNNNKSSWQKKNIVITFTNSWIFNSLFFTIIDKYFKFIKKPELVLILYNKKPESPLDLSVGGNFYIFHNTLSNFFKFVSTYLYSLELNVWVVCTMLFLFL